MPKKPETAKVAARAVGRGAVVWVGGREEVVRGVSVILHLANGIDLPTNADQEVEVLKDQKLISKSHRPQVGE